MVNRDCKRGRVKRRLRAGAYVAASLFALAWPFVRDLRFQSWLAQHFQRNAGSAAQQAAELFAMFTDGSLYPYSLALDWPFHVACVVFAARALWLLRRDQHVPGHCRRCGYNLTGLTEARCPECGTRFLEEYGT